MSIDALATGGWLRLSSRFDDPALRASDTDDALSIDGAGSRNLLMRAWCAALVEPIRARLRASGLVEAGAVKAGTVGADAIEADTVAVQCTLFRKTAVTNWKVPYHQDLSIPVAQRVQGSALQGWSSKDDGHYVQPPPALLERMLAVRLHLDRCGEHDGALRVLPGTHRRGRVSLRDIPTLRATHAERICLANAGDLLLMRPLLLHASSKADIPRGRRVLHFLFGPPQPGFGLQWRIAI
jgi:Phytanoyl-CoA dioxygenase (PhyH)